MNLFHLFESILFPPAPQAGPGLPPPVEKKKAKATVPDSGIRFTEDNIPYKEIATHGEEVSAWHILNAQTAGAAKRSSLCTSEHIEMGVNLGFAPETIALVYMHWKEGRKQVEIARATRLSIDTVKKITPIFKK